jgi:hypothetical protein
MMMDLPVLEGQWRRFHYLIEGRPSTKMMHVADDES